MTQDMKNLVTPAQPFSHTATGRIDLGGYGVTYAYGYDPEGNMFEMEQLDPNPGTG